MAAGRRGRELHGGSDFRAAGSYDARPDIKIPVGLAVAVGRHNNPREKDATSGIWFWSVRIAEQGRDDYSIGLDLQMSYYTTSADADMQLLQVTVDMRYFY